MVAPLSAQDALSLPHEDFRRRLVWSPEGAMSNLTLRLYGFGRLDFQRRTLFNDGTADSSTITWRSSRVTLRARHVHADEDRALNSRLEYDFREGTQARPRPRLRLAYAEAEISDGWALLAGQAYDVWYIYCPSLLTSIYPVNRRPQLRLTKTTEFEDNTLLTVRAAAVRNSCDNIDDAHSDANSKARRALFQGAIILERPWLTERAARIALAGSYGRECYEFQDERDADGLYDTGLVNSYGWVPLCEWFALSGAVYGGENLDTYFMGGAAQGVSGRRGETIKGVGGWAQGTYYHTRYWRFNAGYSFLHLQDHGLAAGERDQYECYSINTAYFLKSGLQLVLEGNYFFEERLGASCKEHAQLQCSIYYFF